MDSALFSSMALRDMKVPNRIVVSPMAQYKAVDGCPTDWHLIHYGERAKGGAGLVFTEMTCVSATGRITPGCPGLYAPEHEAAVANAGHLPLLRFDARARRVERRRASQSTKRESARNPASPPTTLAGEAAKANASPPPGFQIEERNRRMPRV